MVLVQPAPLDCVGAMFCEYGTAAPALSTRAAIFIRADPGPPGYFLSAIKAADHVNDELARAHRIGGKC